MKKLTVLFVALSTMAMTAMAQCPKSGDRPDCKGDRPECKKEQCDRQGAPQDKMYRPTNPCELSMEGILLSVEQQKAVEDLQAEFKAKKQQCDGDAPKRVCRQQIRKDYIARMKQILTPEQYVTYLENIVNLDAQNPRFHKGPKGPRPDGMKCDKASKCDKAPGMKDCKKADCKKADCKKADCKKADCKKADCKKADCKKADCKKADCKKADCKKADCKKAK